MRQLNTPKLINVGAVQVGVHHYWVQHYYPCGGTQYAVYVFKRHTPQARGLVFKDEAAYRTWATNAPMQHELF
jgi:hypothetical protein